MGFRWTEGMLGAWNYAREAVERGMSGNASLKEFRAGGGHVRTQDWYTLYRGAEDAGYQAEIAARLPQTYTVPGGAFWEVDVKYTSKYQMHYGANTVTDEGEVITDIWRTVQSDIPLTMTEWRALAVKNLRLDKSIPGIQEVEITGIDWTKRME